MSNSQRQEIRPLTDFEIDMELIIKDLREDEQKLSRILEKTREKLDKLEHAQTTLLAALEMRRHWHEHGHVAEDSEMPLGRYGDPRRGLG